MVLFRQDLTPNIHELTWVKYGGEVYRLNLINKLFQKYIELYTAIQYENKKDHKSYIRNIVKKEENGILGWLKNLIS